MKKPVIPSLLVAAPLKKLLQLPKRMLFQFCRTAARFITPDAAATPFVPGPAYMKVHSILSRSIGSFFFILLILVLYSLLFPEWLYDQIRFMDAFAYLGHILNPAIQRHGFPNSSSGDVLPAILPGHLLHTIFRPIIANFIYKVLLATGVTFFLFKIVQKYFGLKLALLSILLTLTNSFFLASVGSYYVLAAVIFYVAAVLFFITKACENKTRARIIYLGLVGFFILCMISSAILTIVFTPCFFFLFYALKKWERGRTFDFEDLIVPLGFIIGMLFFCIIHNSYAHHFVYFVNTIKKVLFFLHMDRTPGPPTAWISGARWLTFSGVILLYALLRAILAREGFFRGIIDAMRFKINPQNAFLLACNLSLVLLSYLQFYRQQGTISDPYYFSQCLPLITLGLVAIIHEEYQGVRFSRRMAPYIGVVFLGLVAGYKYQSDVACARLFYLLCLTIYLSVVLNRARMALRGILSCVFLGSSIALGLILSQVTGFLPRYTPEAWSYKDVATGRAMTVGSLKREYFLRTVEWFNLVNEMDPARETLMWYDDREPYGRLFTDFCAASHIWQGGLINQRFPLINIPDNGWRGPTHIVPQAGMEILVLTGRKDKKMAELSGTLGGKGLKFVVLQGVRFDHSFATFDVLKIRLLPA